MAVQSGKTRPASVVTLSITIGVEGRDERELAALIEAIADRLDPQRDSIETSRTEKAPVMPSPLKPGLY